jgi:hypothetical protein
MPGEIQTEVSRHVTVQSRSASAHRNRGDRCHGRITPRTVTCFTPLTHGPTRFPFLRHRDAAFGTNSDYSTLAERDVPTEGDSEPDTNRQRTWQRRRHSSVGDTNIRTDRDRDNPSYAHIDRYKYGDSHANRNG